jgi:hypothetical protein
MRSCHASWRIGGGRRSAAADNPEQDPPVAGAGEPPVHERARRGAVASGRATHRRRQTSRIRPLMSQWRQPCVLRGPGQRWGEHRPGTDPRAPGPRKMHGRPPRADDQRRPLGPVHHDRPTRASVEWHRHARFTSTGSGRARRRAARSRSTLLTPGAAATRRRTAARARSSGRAPRARVARRRRPSPSGPRAPQAGSRASTGSRAAPADTPSRTRVNPWPPAQSCAPTCVVRLTGRPGAAAGQSSRSRPAPSRSPARACWRAARRRSRGSTPWCARVRRSRTGSRTSRGRRRSWP